MLHIGWAFSKLRSIIIVMSARPVIKTSTMTPDMQEAAIQVAQDAVRDNNFEKEIANAIKAAFEGLYPSL